ncbi:MAG: DMT family transporter [Pseudomonadota bacterium]
MTHPSTPTDQISFSSRAWADLGLLGLIWGGVFLATRLALDEVPVLTLVLHRVFWAALALWIWVAIKGLSVPRDLRTLGALLTMGFLNNALPFALLAWGQLTIESGLTAILNATTALFGVLVAAVVFRDERLTRAKVLGVLVGLAGVVVAIGPAAVLQLDPRSLAQLAVLAGTVSYALASTWGRLTLTGLSPEVAAAGMLTGATLLLAPVALWVDGVPSLDLSLTTWSAIGYAALVATAGAYLLYYRVLAAAGAGNLMIVTLVIPPVAIVLGALVLGETLTAESLVGFALLAVGLLTLNGTLSWGRRSAR